jgi:RimJ/RimL family protein N-acetyltransferase
MPVADRENAAGKGGEVGAVVGGAPAERPSGSPLEGHFARVEKLDASRHGEALWAAVKDDPGLWTYMAYGPFADRAAFNIWLEARAAAPDPFAYAVIDKSTGKATGSATLMEIRPAARVIEMGNIVYGPSLQRTPVATEAQFLLARHVFEDLGYRRYEWKCNALNAPSMRAAERLGFTYEGTFRQHMIIKGRNRDTAWFAMIDRDWPAIKARFEQWLAPGNFDRNGKQKMRLREQT